MLVKKDRLWLPWFI